MNKILFSLIAITALVFQNSATLAQVSEFQLDNGIRVVVTEVPEAEDVGVEAIYDVGFVDEPAGMVQSSHLLEHLVCFGDGAGFAPKEAMDWLNSVGVANAETLPDFTHYDYVVAAKHFEKILEIESARLQLKQFDRVLIVAEAQRVYRETDFVENNPAAGMVKHAFMVCAHAWNYQPKSALVRGGLETMDPKKLMAFYQATYRPDNLTLYVTGKTTLAEAKTMVEKHLGKIEKPKSNPSEINWGNVPKTQTVQWDSKNSSVCVTWDPPADASKCRQLSIIGAGLAQNVLRDKDLKAKCSMIMVSNNLWTVGDLPFFIYAMAKPGESLDDIESMLTQYVNDNLPAQVNNGPMMGKMFAAEFAMQSQPGAWQRMQEMSKFMKKAGRSESQAIQLSLLQDALNSANQRRLLGIDPEKTVEKLKALSKDDFQQTADECFTEEHRRVVKIVPMKK